MKVKSLAQLKHLVEASGMSLDQDGKVAAQAKPAPSQTSGELLAAVYEMGDKTRSAIESNAKLFAEALKSLPTSAQGKPILKWVFTVRRGEDGFMSEIVAEAKFDRKVEEL